MKPMRTILLLAFGLITVAQTIQAQCSASAVPTAVSCFGYSNGSIDLTASNGTAPYTYAWSNNQTTEDIANLAAGTYTCTVTDNVGCTATAVATVTTPSPMSISLTDQTLTCIVTSVDLNPSPSGGTPPYTYLWWNNATTNSIQVQQPGAYALTVTDSHGCTATKLPVVTMDVNAPIASAGPDLILTCAVTSVTLDGSASSSGPNFTYLWTTGNGNIISGGSTLFPIVDQPGTYQLVVTNTINGCTSTDIVMVLQDIVAPLVSIGPDIDMPCGTSVVTLSAFVEIFPSIAVVWTTPNGNIVSGANTANPVVNAPGAYTIVVTNLVNGCTASATINVTGNGSGLCSQIVGRVMQDTVENCQFDAGEPPLQGWIVVADGPLGTYFDATDNLGNYEIYVATGGDYAVSAAPASGLWGACPPIAQVTATNPNQTYVADDLMFQKLAGCPLMTVAISSGNLRRCFDNNTFYVNYCNIGTEPAEDAYVDITFEPWFSIVNASQSYTNQGNNVYRFDVGDVAPGQCGSFYIVTLLSCDAVLGQTHCTEAHIYPDSSCVPTNPLWSGASLVIDAQCQGDSLRFTIKNVGTGDMTNSVDYIVIEDQVMLMSAPLQLDAGESTVVSVPANGSTWRLEVEQVPFHPGHSEPSLSVEGCSPNGFFSTGFVNQFPADDSDDYIDIDCQANTASSDPNDKQGFPSGYGPAHYIRPGTPLSYKIRFQNTGNDTAFTVRIVDTLSTWLDPTSIRPGASSHPYSWDLSGAGVLTFQFEHILLPDSNVNEPASHGFVDFTISPRADAPLESVIENTAGIYFDFNEAVVTNTTFHRLGENFVTVGLWQPAQSGYEVRVSPNPFSDVTWVEVKGLRRSAPVQLKVFDLQGEKRIEMESTNGGFQLKKGSLPSGVYPFNLLQNGTIVGSGKLMVQ